MLILLRRLVLVCIIRPIAYLVIGFDVRGAENLPRTGPAIIAANHNSHVDTLLLLSLFRSRLLPRIRPVAASDHFLTGGLASWFYLNCVGILPVNRRARGREDVLAGCRDALSSGDILLIFPEGTRGEPEQMGALKTGIARLAEAFPDCPVVPVYLQGAGRVLPRGSVIPVPFVCSAVIGDALRWSGGRDTFMTGLRDALAALKAEAPPLRWL
ncbi:lysophospholipid acyltransferase family protein [Maricaulis maris]|jgi:1-acyl-sn-glycerol-3-phosphate acyltransferase|uniref:lysophospholipid acyltransferase family protein n=1 Tax=Maricaulis maris TaxID=74318 RepID=UPI00292705DB|nr:1-acyl-sn-glycerol-3-phosphate acyltransferase [Maricaulis maris]